MAKDAFDTILERIGRPMFSARVDDYGDAFVIRIPTPKRILRWIIVAYKYNRGRWRRRHLKPIVCHCSNCKRVIPEWWGGYENLHLGPACDICAGSRAGG